MKNYIKLIRVKHWLKNFLVFMPLFFSLSSFFDDEKILINAFLGFLTFSFVSSIVYVINDINDLENDRKHPKKKNRPLASGAISVSNAKMTVMLLIVLSLLFATFIYTTNDSIFVFLIPIIYVILNVLYSKWLKHIPIIDVVILVSGFVLRVMYGGVVVNIEVSKWLYLTVIFGSFFLGLGKRRNEIIKNGSNSRKVLSLYNKQFLDKNMYMACTLAIMSYSLWCVDADTILRVGHDYLFWTIPLVMVIFQCYSLDIEGDSHGDPIEVILSDKRLISLVTLYGLIMVFLLYFI